MSDAYIVVLYYSRNGHVKQLAEEIAQGPNNRFGYDCPIRYNDCDGPTHVSGYLGHS